MARKRGAKEMGSLKVDGIGEVRRGMELEHPLFGLGEVEAIFERAKSRGNTIQINFETHGSIALAPEYAKLSLPKKAGRDGSL